MTEYLVVYQALLTLSTIVSTLTAAYAWRHRNHRGGIYLAILLTAAATWAGSSLFGTFSYASAGAIFWHKVGLTSVVVLVLGFFLFTLSYTGREPYLTPTTVGALSIEPVVFGALVWTNESHDLVWRDTIVTETGDLGIEFVHGPLFTVHKFYSYTLLAIGVLLIIVFVLRSRYLYQRQVAAIVVATVVPWFANVVYQSTGLTYDPTPTAFSVTALALTWAVVRADFLDITPVATEMILETIDTAVFVVDDEGRIVDINHRGSEVLGIDPSEAVGESARSLLAPYSNVKRVYDEMARSNTVTTREIEMGDRYVRMQMSPLFEQRAELVGRVFLVVDLTEQREREEELRRRNEQLDRFAGVVSHDLRNPLDVASSSMALARETGDDEHFDRAERAHERMDRLIEDILALARQTDESVEGEPVLLSETAREAWKYVDTADASLSVLADGSTVRADPDRLSQLFENLFRNAVEHGGDDVIVTVGVSEDESGFYVADSGPGFDDGDVDVVFEDGYTTTGTGTGFGLSIVEEIATQHGWSVSATEDDAGGARIDVQTAGLGRD